MYPQSVSCSLFLGRLIFGGQAAFRVGAFEELRAGFWMAGGRGESIGCVRATEFDIKRGLERPFLYTRMLYINIPLLHDGGRL